MTIPGSGPFAAAPYGAQPVVPVNGPEGGPYTVMSPAAAVLLPSAVRNATVGSADMPNPGYRGVIIILVVTAASGTGGLQIVIEGKDAASGNYYILNALPVAVLAANVVVYLLYPGVATAGVNIAQVTSSILPEVWRIAVIHGDGSNYTYSVGAVLLP